ncbi:cephalosporin-C deacetylase [Diaminobutyricimonas aerilata]|uniref:Cephalosporin-C deacetylase n=1 Tax=Diaminobutyricimonas aerilata TaxID=1162967 RepID=A0A2M9CGL9_9MICO|nr:acetylxylan esterase [Diaminobutyricimonas aerilata]PJJ71071.1 cephalosporin-C deacetylase [Diaminobutyricimonas aerilata]
MGFFDMPLEQLRDYRPDIAAPDDLESFWRDTLGQARALPIDARFERVETALTLVDTYDVTFTGFGGTRVKGWLHVPAGTDTALPGVVEYIGYGGARGLAHQNVTYALAGYAHLIMDTRGHGWWAAGDTPDDSGELGTPGVPGLMTRGISDPSSYYYRRLYTDAARAVDAARSVPLIDPERVVVTGGSQGGALALVAASLVPDVAGVMSDVPFLSHFDRAIGLTGRDPYNEIVRYLSRYRDQVATVRRTLSYFDCATLVGWATAPALFSTALMDETCAPSTVFAAFNRYAGDDKRIEVYEFNDHEGGAEHHQLVKFAWLRELLGRL